MQVSGQLHAPAALSTRQNPIAYWIGGRLAPRTGLGGFRVEKISCSYWDYSFGLHSPCLRLLRTEYETLNYEILSSVWSIQFQCWKPCWWKHQTPPKHRSLSTNRRDLVSQNVWPLWVPQIKSLLPSSQKHISRTYSQLYQEVSLKHTLIFSSHLCLIISTGLDLLTIILCTFLPCLLHVPSFSSVLICTSYLCLVHSETLY